MNIELYARPAANQPLQSPISNTSGTLPDGEPTLNLRDLLGNFSSQEEALAYISQQVSQQNGVVSESRSGPFNDYTHIEWLTVTITSESQPIEIRTYYLVTDEGY